MEIWSFNENCERQKVEDLSTLSDVSLIWVDCSPAELSEAQALLRDKYNLTIYERHVADCLNPQHPCSFESVQDYYILVFRSIPEQMENSLFETTAVSFITSEKVLLTVNNRDPSIAKVKSRLVSVRKNNTITSEYLIYSILNQIIDNFLQLKIPLSNQFNFWEKILLHQHKDLTDWSKFLKYKSDIRQLTLICEEQEDVIAQWHDDLDIHLNEQMAVRINDLADHTRRVVRHTQRLESDVESLVQLHYLVIGHRTNEIVRVLTVISCIFMPLTLITGIFGMNFHKMGMLENPHGYPYTIISMIVLSILLLVFFRWNEWI